MKAKLFAATSASVLAVCALGVSTAAAQAPAASNPNAPIAQPQAPDPQGQTTTEGAGVAGATGQADTPTVNTVVVTGSTSKRTLLNASVAVTDVTQEQLLEKAPRSTADVLETIPGIYLQGTAGPVSNN